MNVGAPRTSSRIRHAYSPRKPIATSTSPLVKELTTISDGPPGDGDVPERGPHAASRCRARCPPGRRRCPASDAIRIGAAEKLVSMSIASLTRLRKVQLERPPARVPRS